MAAESGGGRKFHLKERLGEGAFGAVYLAEQDSGAGFTRRVALKVLNTGVQHFAEAGRRMRDEARILGRLAHRNIVTVIDLVKLGDQWAVVMDYIPGADADRLLEALKKTEARFPVPAALEIGSAVCEALHFAYNADDGKGGKLGVLHRDVKPSNILITADGDVKVLDFGVARVNLEVRESRTGLRVGTERYMSPQRICGEEDDLAGDVYAIAATIAELILGTPVGRTPVSDDKHELFVAEARVNLRARLQGPPDAIDRAIDVLANGLAMDPDKRPTPRAMSDAMLELSRKLEGEALITFARGFVPQVDGLMGTSREPISGTLAESMSRLTEGGSQTFADTGEADDPADTLGKAPAGTTDAPAAPGGQRHLVPAVAAIGVVLVALIAVSGLVAGGAIAVGAFTLGGRGNDAAAAVATPPDAKPVVQEPLPAPAITPPVEPPPVEPPPTEPALVATTDPVVTAPRDPPKRATEPPKGVEPVITSDAPRIDRAMVVLKDASSIDVKCGDTTASGTASARITGFPAGNCKVTANYVGKALETTVRIDSPAQVNCTVEGDKLTCQ